MTKLETINAEDLQNRTYEPTHFLVDELIPEGLHILAGAPKIGKSWLALWLCLCVAQGQPLWNFATTQGEALYLSLEDSFQRIQTRLFDLTEDTPPTLHFAIMADTLKHGLEQQIEQFLMEHPTTKLVVIDTLQRVRGTGSDSNLYANDYQDVEVEPGSGAALLGEVSQCNDDNTDNSFNPPVGRFPKIEEDEAPYRLLCNEYLAAKGQPL